MFEIFLTSSHYWFHVFDVQLYFVCAQRGEMLIFFFLILTFWFWTECGVRCVGTFYASVGENIQKKCHFCLYAHAYTTPFLFRVPQVLETWLTCVCWHLTWNSWIVSIEIERQCLFNTPFSSFNFHLYLLRNSKVLFARAVVSRRLSGKILTCSWYVACGGVVRPALVIFPISLIHPLVLQLCECPFETITLPILFYQFTMLRFSLFILHLLGFYSLILNWIMLILLHNEIV